MGVLMVIGIAVSNGILLVDDANRRLRERHGSRRRDRQRGPRPVHADRDDEPRHDLRLLPTALGLEGTGRMAARTRGGRRAHSSTLLSLFLVPVIFVLIAKRAPAAGGAPATEPALSEATT